jgi:predicted esterase YcpF (UPF0227 family)
MAAGAKLLFYFNGFNSAIPADWSDNEKLVAVEEFARSHGYRFLPTSVDYRRATERAREILESAGPGLGGVQAVLFSGSSMGGWYARVMQLLLAARRPGLPCEALAFNPAFDLGLHGHLLLGPQLNFVTGEAYEWTEADGRRLAALEASVDFDAALPFFVYVDKGDEVIGWSHSAERHAPIAHFRAFEGGSHSFEHAREALADYASVRAALEARRTNW